MTLSRKSIIKCTLLHLRKTHLSCLPPLTWQILNYLYTASIENERNERSSVQLQEVMCTLGNSKFYTFKKS
jgi:hypothetical protein